MSLISIICPSQRGRLVSASKAQTRTFLPVISVAILVFLAVSTSSAQTGSAYSRGTPADSKGGQAPSSAVDKIENVSLTNGDLSVNLPLATVGGRGSAAYTISMAYNSKLWSGKDENEVVDEGFGPTFNRAHRGMSYNEGLTYQPGKIDLGGGWIVAIAPAIKTQVVSIHPYLKSQCAHPDESGSCGYKYVITKMWITLPDGSQVEMRDALTGGSPALTPFGSNGGISTDRDRGRIWYSTDGSAITFVADTSGVGVAPTTGWVFLSDGTRLRMSNSLCTSIEDRQGNYVTITYNTDGSKTYTDELGRQTILQPTTGGVTITVKGYNGVSDRVITIDTGAIAPDDPNVAAVNLRSDYQSVTRPILSGDIDTYETGGHTTEVPHTDLFTDVDAWETVAMGDVKAVTGVHLLDGRQFVFRYNPYGELAEIVYPGGGVSQMDYQAFGSNVCEGGPLASQLGRRVTQRRTQTTAGTTDATWRYSWSAESVDGVTRPTTTVEARSGTSTSGTLLSSDKHYFLANDSEYRFCVSGRYSDGTGYETWDNGREFRTDRLTGTGTQITKRTWQQKANVAWTTPDVGLSYNAFVAEHGQQQPPNDVRMTQEDVILENGKMKRTEYGYDNFNNVTSIIEHDFGTDGSPGAVLRQTTRTYASNINGYCYTSTNGADSNCASGSIASDMSAVIHQRRLMLSQTVADASNVQKAYTEVEYDNYVPDSTHAAIITNTSMIQYDGSKFSAFNSTIQPRGNPTRSKSWSGSSNYIYAYSQYDNAGNVIKVIDPNGNASTVSYADNFGDGMNPDSGSTGNAGATFAFPTLATNALGMVTKTQYDYTFAAASGAKDVNGAITRVEFDAIGRPFRTTAAYGTTLAVKSEATFPTATSNTAIGSSQIDATHWAASKTEFDGFDQPIKTWKAEDGYNADSGSFTIAIQTIRDELGRAKQVSNPYRPATDSPVYTTSTFDLAGRVTTITTPDSAQVTTAYDSDRTMVVDQAGKKRISKTNALGQMSDVWEITASDSATESVTFPNYSGLYGYKTSYAYDLLNNLTTVTQGAQTRAFAYNSLSRLTSASNPESGTINYAYDNNGNLTSKTDARTITTTYAYDALNRVTTRSYSNEPSGQTATPTVTYTYDDTNIAYSKGKLTKVASSVSTTEYTSFDILGKVTGHKQTTNSTAYTTGYTYNLGGALLTETYPSGRIVQNTLAADGDLSMVKTKTSNGKYETRSWHFTYNAAGAVTSMQLGNGYWESAVLNNRLQPTQIALGTTQNGYDLLKLNFDYGSTDNNGNVKSQTITVPGLSQPFIQNYTYDSLNRLASATETNNSTQAWKQTFTYDRYGNRNFDEANTTMPTSFSTPAVSDPTVSTMTNRITSSGYNYDSSGNTTYDASLRKYTYDAENKQVKVESTNSSQTVTGTLGEYSYDGDGRRVKKYNTSTSDNIIFIYDAAGKLIEERNSSSCSGACTLLTSYVYAGSRLLSTETAATGATTYLTADHLGSPRINTDGDGTVVARHDYMPFGEEIFSLGGRTSGLGYVGDGVRKQFTGYERDGETSLDFAQSRYNNANLGRFASPDNFGGKLSNPQSLNLYAYTLNNPLKWVDPTGHSPDDPCTKDGKAEQCWADDKNQAHNADDSYYNLPGGPDMVVNVSGGEGNTGPSDQSGRDAGPPDLPDGPTDLIPILGSGRRMLYNMNCNNGGGCNVNRALSGFVHTSVDAATIFEGLLEAGGELFAKEVAEETGIVATDEAEETFAGGAYREVTGNPGTEAHHIPADSVTSIRKADGPAIQMTKADHRVTLSWGPSNAAKAYRNGIKNLVENGQMRNAMAQEIKDVRRVGGSKYNGAIRQMLNYAREKGIVPRK